jgi:hypothetical protein
MSQLFPCVTTVSRTVFLFFSCFTTVFAGRWTDRKDFPSLNPLTPNLYSERSIKNPSFIRSCSPGEKWCVCARVSVTLPPRLQSPAEALRSEILDLQCNRSIKVHEILSECKRDQTDQRIIDLNSKSSHKMRRNVTNPVLCLVRSR